MLRMPAFGLSGPWRDRPGFAQTMEQITGMAWVTGYDGGPPIIAGGVVDPMVGTHAALALVAALEHRERTGEGQLVEVPLIEVATAVTAEQVIRYSVDGTLVDRRGEGGVYECATTTTWVAVDRGARSDVGGRACGMVHRAIGRSGGRGARARKAYPPRRSCPRTPRSTTRSCRHAGSSRRSSTSTSARSSIRPGRCACRPGPRRGGPDRHRRSVSTPTTCCARARLLRSRPRAAP